MKKLLSVIIALLLVLTCFALPISAEKEPDTVYNLIPNDATITYTEVNGVTAEATFDENGTLTVKAASQWPVANLEYAEPYTFEIAKATLKVKFELKNGGTSFRISTPDSDKTTGTYEIFVHHFIKDATFDGAGDLATPGVYEFEIPFSELAYCDWTAGAAFSGKLPIETEEITLSSIEIYSVSGAEIVIEKLEVVVEGNEIIEVSEEPSEEPSEETSQPDTPPTGDNGFVVLAVVSAIALAGAMILKKR